MTSIRTFTAFSLLIAAFASPLFSAEPPADKDASPAENVATEKPLPPFTISEETTRLTEPLRADGRVDYVAALNKMCSEGVTPENNAVVLILQALGPDVIEANPRNEYYRMLGIKPLPDRGDYLVPYKNFHSEPATKLEKEEEAESQDPAEEQRQFDKFYKNMVFPWTAAKHPRYAAWLKANEKPLKKIIEATERPKYYAPLISSDSENAAMLTVLLPLAMGAKECAWFLKAHALFSIGEGKYEDAQRDLLACHRLARLVGQEVFVVDALVAISIDGIACRGDAALAQSGKMSIREMDAFRAELKKLPPLPKVADKLDIAERFTFLDCVQMLAVKGSDSISALSLGDSSKSKVSLLRSVFTMAAVSPSDWDDILRRGNTWYDRIVVAARKPTFARRTNELYKIDTEIKTIDEELKSLKNVGSSLMAGEALHTIASKKLGDILISLLTLPLNPLIHIEECTKVNSDLAQIAFALDDYRSERGNYPDRLADLAPKYIAKLPKDSFAYTGYIYRREGKGYILYSVGYTGKDDGGKSPNNDPPDEEGDDIVVRTPKEAE